jgi:Ca2+-binding RTX toxin-like protein
MHITVVGGQDDVMQGNAGNDVLHGGGGDDYMYGGTIPTGEVKPPHVVTEADNDELYGGDGNDHMWGNAGDDKLYGETGNDVMSGGKGNDLVDGGVGDDVLSGNTGDDTLVGGDGDDMLSGNADNDTFHDGDGNDTVVAGSGDDVAFAGEGDDTYNGNSGFDTIDFSGAKGGMTIDVSKKTADGMGHDTFWNFEKIVGSAFDDTMKGSKSAEWLVGGDGNDALRGMEGADTLTGGAGRDTFQWMAKDLVSPTGKLLGVDVVTDFSSDDVLDLRKVVGSGWTDIGQVVSVHDDGQSSHVTARIGEAWVQVVTLEGVTGLNVHDMLHDGMLLA